MNLKPGFTGSPLDRADHIRVDDEAVAAARADPRARFLRLTDLDPVTTAGALSWAPLVEAPAGELAFLGLLDGAPCFAPLSLSGEPFTHTQRWNAINALPEGEAATYAAARSLVDWHARHGFCARCGHATAPFRAGWGRKCPNCTTEHFPRTDPVAIMLAQHEDKVLVGRQHRWPPGMYSALAGFIEVGESIEGAVARELFEEAGVVATSVRYLTSQPWPFPSQLMIACIATVESSATRLDESEIEDVMWITRDQARAVIAREEGAPFHMAHPFAIAYTLVKAWSEGA